MSDYNEWTGNVPFLNWKLLYVHNDPHKEFPVIAEVADPQDGLRFGKQYAGESLTWVITREGHYCGFTEDTTWSLQLRNPYYDFYLERTNELKEDNTP